MIRIDHPYGIDGRGRTAETSHGDHLRDLIEQLLFTSPGERVMRPDFGGGVLQLVFAPAGSELAATTQYLVQGALQQWLGDLIRVDRVDVSAGEEEGVVRVTVEFTELATEQRHSAGFERRAGGGP